MVLFELKCVLTHTEARLPYYCNNGDGAIALAVHPTKEYDFEPMEELEVSIGLRFCLPPGCTLKFTSWPDIADFGPHCIYGPIVDHSFNQEVKLIVKELR